MALGHGLKGKKSLIFARHRGKNPDKIWFKIVVRLVCVLSLAGVGHVNEHRGLVSNGMRDLGRVRYTGNRNSNKSSN
jgi:hypothetical protein